MSRDISRPYHARHSYIKGVHRLQKRGDKHSKDLRLVACPVVASNSLAGRAIKPSSHRLQDSSEFGKCEKMVEMVSVHACTADLNTLVNPGGGCVCVIMGRVKSARRSREAEHDTQAPSCGRAPPQTDVALVDSTALIYPFRRRANAPRAICRLRVESMETPRMAQMEKTPMARPFIPLRKC